MAKQNSKLNPSALFDSTEKLIQGYNLTAAYGKKQKQSEGGTGRKVYLVGRPLKSGNVSLVRYSFHDGKRERESTGKVLRVELDATIKACNRDIVREERASCDILEKELEVTGMTFAANTRGNVLLSEFLHGSAEKAAELDSVGRTMRSLSWHVKAYRDVPMRDVSEAWVRGFVKYLKNDAVGVFMKHNPKKLGRNTQNKLLVVLSVALNRAKAERMILFNPCLMLSKGERISAKPSTRTFLEADDVRKLVETECVGDRHGYDIKNGFLFSVLTGLRWSDLIRLRPCDIAQDAHGVHFNFNMKKTGDELRTYIGKQALALLPEQKNVNEPYFRMPGNKTTNFWLSEWVKAAGITKKVTFHCLSHYDYLS